MAVPTINFGGFVYDDSGDAVSGATINLFDKNDTTTSRASTTTNSSGYWAVAHTTSGEFDVQITSGSSKRRIKFFMEWKKSFRTGLASGDLSDAYGS